MTLRYGSVCSGIEAATVAWHPLGWRPSFFSEIEAFPRAALAHHYPEVPLHGDFTTIREGQYDAIDLLVGGTPCQSFSVAGLRGGLDDERGNLALEYLKLAQRLRPRWLVWENVPGVLSSNGGRDFGSILGGLVELGYGFAYRVLDAQFVRVDGYPRAVPQRRRRVFVVGYLGDWRRAAAVLLEREGLSGNPAPRREAGKGAARPLASGTQRGSGYRNDADTVDNLIAFGGGNTSGEIDAAACLTAKGQRIDFEVETFVCAPALTGNAYGDHEGREGLLVTHALRAEGFDASEDGTGRGTPIVPVAFQTRGGNLSVGEVSGTLGVNGGSASGAAPMIAFDCKASGRNGFGIGEIAPTLRAMGHKDSHTNAGGQVAVAFGIDSDCLDRSGEGAGGTPGERAGLGITAEHTNALKAKRPGAVAAGWQVRRLMPAECERLQGFPDDYTLIPWRKAIAPDGPRYKALGNSMAVNVMRWIGMRIQMVEAIATLEKAA